MFFYKKLHAKYSTYVRLLSDKKLEFDTLTAKLKKTCEDREELAALKEAEKRIRLFHERQKQDELRLLEQDKRRTMAQIAEAADQEIQLMQEQ